MLGASANIKVYIATEAVDMRKAINGLSILVERCMELNVFSGSMFVFTNRRRNLVKILYWDRNGFCLWQKRLEGQRFRWPEGGDEVVEVSLRELRWLLDGLEIVQRGAHRKLNYSSVA
ncbi:transposase [Candidatus Parcubacteria bacterium]|nr:MAG: transposase [Candidatus Parcubacteria bacterium]